MSKLKKYMWILRHGKQVRVKREQPRLIDGVDEDEFIKNNADELWYHQNEMWEDMPEEEDTPF